MPEVSLQFTVLSQALTIAKLPVDATIPSWVCQSDFFNITKTSSELSVIFTCNLLESQDVRHFQNISTGWRALKVEGVLDFSLVGILARISQTLAMANVSIFAISTYDTDYILVRESDLPTAVKALKNEGHRF